MTVLAVAAQHQTVLVLMDLAGIFVFAISGALVAVRKQLDVFGCLVLAGATGLGGGWIRDVLIGAAPPETLTDWRYLTVPLAAGLLTFAFHPAVGRAERVVNVFDAFGLALFCVTGALKALDYGLGPLPAALLGMITGIGGGMVRDLLAGRIPIVLRGELYAIPALAGAAVAVLAERLDQPWWVIAPAGAGVCLSWRLLALWRNWQAPMPAGPASV
ncbi:MULTISPECIES: TRIC cation channel family protein [Nocardioides]|uniref:trimeric intracellular cation channel family protein n=1 Tax=Nocardioides TaxID=1839 RepID=UPI000C77BA69|nr:MULTISPECIES: TRIC cation channel family protein [Nocardioides]